MATCKQCREFEKCKDDSFINGAKFDPNESAKYCTGFEPITNADRIRAMSDEELAEWIHNGISSDACDYCEYNNGYCDGSPCIGKADAETIAEWLKQPAEGD